MHLTDSLSHSPTRGSCARPIDRVLDHLEGVRQTPRGYVACCPAHPDRVPSLSIREGEDGKVLINCHADCDFNEITEAIGLKASDLFPADGAQLQAPAPKKEKTKHANAEKAIQAAHWGVKQRSPEAEIDSIYDYGDGIKVVRFSTKDFCPVHMNCTGWLVGKPEQYPLYHDADIIGTRSSFVFFTEGEKDADNLNKAGLVATTIAGGVNGIVRNLHSADLKTLEGRDIVLLPDNDEPGRKCMAEVAQILATVAKSVRVLDLPGLPAHGDVSDWLDSGNDPENLVRLAESAPDAFQGKEGASDPNETRTHQKAAQSDTEQSEKPRRQLVMRMGSEIQDAGTRYLWKRRFPVAGLSIIFSRPGAGKSTIAADLTARVTQGKNWPDGSTCERGRVIYVKGEGTDASVRDRMRNAGADGAMYGIVARSMGDDSPMIDLAADADLLADQIEVMGNVKLVIVDTLDSVFPSMRMIDNANIRKCLHPLQSLAEEKDVAVVVLAHTNKGGYHDPLDRLSGGRAIGGAARSVWYLGQQDRESDIYWMSKAKVNDFKPAPSIAYEIVGQGDDSPGVIRWGDVDDGVSAFDLDQPPKNDKKTKGEECAEWIADALRAGPMKMGELKTAATVQGYGDKALAKGKALAGVVVKYGSGKGGHQPPTAWACLGDQEPPEGESPI